METQLLNLYLFHLINVERLSGNGPQVLIKKINCLDNSTVMELQFKIV